MAPARDGSAKLSFAFGKKQNTPSKPLTKPSTKSFTKPTPLSALQDSDDEDAGVDRVQQVSHFDQAKGGAIDTSRVKEEKAPRVIQKQSNKDWRREAQLKRQRSALPNQRSTIPDGKNQGDADTTVNEPVVSYGLTIVKKSEQNGTTPGNDENPSNNEPQATQTLKTDDEVAMEALLGNKPKSSLVLPAAENETDAYRRDHREAPDMATLDEYDATPIEEFGAALLRGMGWKDGEAVGRSRGQQTAKPRLLERRPALLGIGAKEDAAVSEELGAWGKGAQGRRKVDQAYNPVLLRNTKTGEQMTEDELKAREEQKRKDESRGERRRRSRSRDRHRDDDRRPSKRKRYARDDGYERSRKDRRHRGSPSRG